MDTFLTPYGLPNSGEEKLQFTPFGGGPKPSCSDGLFTWTIESHNFFCLSSYPGEISHSNSPNRGLSNDILDLVVRRKKLHFTPFHTLCQLKRDEQQIPPLGRFVGFRMRYCQIPVRGFWGVGKIWRPSDLRSRSYKRLYTHTRTQGD